MTYVRQQVHKTGGVKDTSGYPQKEREKKSHLNETTHTFTHKTILTRTFLFSQLNKRLEA